MYGREVKTYRDVLNEKGLPHSKETTKESQKAILDYMVDTLQEFKVGDKVIFDRCPLDNLVYSMWAMSQEGNDIDEDFIDECIPIVNEALKNLDSYRLRNIIVLILKRMVIEKLMNSI